MSKENYKYEVGEIVNNQIILKRFFKFNPKVNYNESYYEIQCLKCGYITERQQNRLSNKTGCGVCQNTFIVSGYNDVATTNPELVKYFVNQEESKKYSIGSHKKIEVICPYCHTINTGVEIRHLKTTFKCKVCGNKGSFNERFMKSVLDNMNIPFEDEKVFKWSNQKRYDIYIYHRYHVLLSYMVVFIIIRQIFTI